MGKKKANKKKKISKKIPATRKSSRKKVVRKKPVKKKATQKRATTKKKAARKIGLGRPIIPTDARLDRVFLKDYRAREIFAFLRVKTIRELEKFTPDKIVELLTGPMVQSVQRIRKTLALGNRSLAKDQKFALEFKNQWKTK